MKKVFLLICILSGLIACQQDQPGTDDSSPRTVFLKSYIQYFVECGHKSREFTVQLSYGLIEDNDQKTIEWRGSDIESSAIYGINDNICIHIESRRVLVRDSSEFYNVPQIGSSGFLFSNGDDPNESFYLERQKGYDKYIEMVGDTSFNKKVSGLPHTISIITPLRDIAITCDKNFGANYPAGSNLSEIFMVFFDDIYSTVRNGYRPVEDSYAYYPRGFNYEEYNPQSLVKVRLSEANFPERPFIGNAWNCILDVAPEHTDTYTFTVKVTLVDGTLLESKVSAVNIRGSKD
jgi:hypothetical protein